MTTGSLMKSRKYCRVLPLEHSAILLTCIKQQSVLKIIFGVKGIASQHYKIIMGEIYCITTLGEDV